jgi:signal transduction histidine kinase
VTAGWLAASVVWLYYMTPVLAWSPSRPWHHAAVIGVFGLIAVATLLLRRRAPLLCVLLVGGCLVLSPAAVGAGFVAQATIAVRQGRSSLVVLTGCFLWAATAGRLLRGPYYEAWTQASVVELTFALLGLVVATAIGFLWRGLAADEDAIRKEAAAAREEADRARLEQVRLSERESIAREMHDVVAHRISLIAMHSAALAHRDDLDSPTTRETAALIQQNAKGALDELRTMLSQLRGAAAAPEPPQPTLQELPTLVAEARGSGQRVELSNGGQISDLPVQVSRSAFRIVQEGLTNARKHAPGAWVRVEVTVEPAALTVTVINPLSELALPATNRSGMGLIGVAERVSLLGGSMRAGGTDGRYELSVTIPTTTGTKAAQAT